jgi:hypothetical protein
MATTRPTAVTVVAIIALASGVISTIRAILDLASFNTIPGIIGLIVGILTLGVSAGLFARSRVARIIATVVLLLQVGSSILTISSRGFTSFDVILPIAAVLLALTAIVMLYTPRSNAFFR